MIILCSLSPTSNVKSQFAAKRRVTASLYNIFAFVTIGRKKLEAYKRFSNYYLYIYNSRVMGPQTMRR